MSHTLLCGVTGAVVIPIFSNDFIGIMGKLLEIIFVVCIVLAFITLIIYSLIVLIVLLKDYKALKHNDFISIIGKVIGFKKNINSDSGTQINDHPIIMIVDTNEKVVLDINDIIMVGEIYKFNYLKNSKIAEVVEKL